MGSKACSIIGSYEVPDRVIPDRGVERLQAEAAHGALLDAGLSLSDVDGFFGYGGYSWAPPLTLCEYIGIEPAYIDYLPVGGSASVAQIGHAVAAISAGKCSVALVTNANRPRSGKQWAPIPEGAPEDPFELFCGTSTIGEYAMVAQRHMYEFGTTSRQLAEIKAAASQHAQHNANALRQEVVTIEDVLASPLISDPLRRLDCCVVTDGAGALVIVADEIAKQLERRAVRILGHGEGVKHRGTGSFDLTYTATRGAATGAFAETAGIKPSDIDYAGIYDSFTITALLQIEDMGFCEKGEGGRFVSDGSLVAPFGRLPVNTDGGGLCANHPDEGGMYRTVEAVRQLRGEAHPAVQVPNCELAIVSALSGSIGTRMAAATTILGQEES